MRQLKFISLILFFGSCANNTKQVNDNRENIKLLWRNKSFDWIISSIYIKDNSVYFGSFNDTFYSANLKDGKLKMKFKTGDDPYFLPILIYDRIYFSSFDLNLYCIDTSGNLIWKTKTTDRIKNDLIEYDSSLFVSVRSDGLRKINKNDGGTVWHLPQNTQSSSTSQPIIFKNKIYVGYWEIDNKVIAVDEQTGKIIWANSYSGFSSSDPALSPNGLIISIDQYYKGGQVKMLDFNTGKEIWSIPLKCEALYKPFANIQNVIIGTYDNKVVWLDNNNGKIKWTLSLEESENLDSRFCSFHNNIYFGTTKRNLYCVDLSSGKLIFKEQFNYGIAEPIVENNEIYFPTGGGELWTLK